MIKSKREYYDVESSYKTAWDDDVYVLDDGTSISFDFSKSSVTIVRPLSLMQSVFYTMRGVIYTIQGAIKRVFYIDK